MHSHAADRVVMVVMLTHNRPGIDRRSPVSWSAYQPAPRHPHMPAETACSRHRQWRGVRRYDATGSSRPLRIRMDLWTKSRLRVFLAVIGRTSTMVDHEDAIRNFLSQVTLRPDTSNRTHSSAAPSDVSPARSDLADERPKITSPRTSIDLGLPSISIPALIAPAAPSGR